MYPVNAGSRHRGLQPSTRLNSGNLDGEWRDCINQGSSSWRRYPQRHLTWAVGSSPDLNRQLGRLHGTIYPRPSECLCQLHSFLCLWGSQQWDQGLSLILDLAFGNLFAMLWFLTQPWWRGRSVVIHQLEVRCWCPWEAWRICGWQTDGQGTRGEEGRDILIGM